MTRLEQLDFSSLPRERAKTKYPVKKIVIGGSVLLGVIIVIVIAVVLNSKRKNDNDEDNVDLVPDPEVPQPPSPSKLRIFKGGGAVCADDFLCAEIGSSILRKNGSAMDAAIATSICSGLGNMQNMGLGGGFIMTFYQKSTGKAYYLNARDKAPIAATSDMYKNKHEKASQAGPLSFAVPGEIAGYFEAHKRFGKLPWSSLFEDTIKLCESGWNLTRTQYDDLFKNKNGITTDPTLKRLFVNETTNKFKIPGSLIKPDKLCQTLRILSEKGAAEFYNGTLGETIIDDLKKKESILTMKDLNEYRIKWEKPVDAKFSDGNRLYSVGFPGSGPLLVFTLNVMDEFQFNNNSIKNWNNTIKTYHRIIETYKYAYAVRSKIGDPDYVDMTELVKNLTSKDYAKLIKSQISDNRTWNDPAHYGAGDELLQDHGTAHISVISPDGDAVSLTSSLNTFFGSGVVSERTGILMNSGMDDFSIPSVVNYFGLPGGSKANVIEPGKRPLSSMVPSILVGPDGNVKMVIGGAGGTKITTAVSFVIARHFWMGETIKEAIDAPRIHHQVYPMKIQYQFGVMKPVVDGLKKLGHETSRYRDRGSVVCALVNNNGTIYANADYRRSGDVRGIE